MPSKSPLPRSEPEAPALRILATEQSSSQVIFYAEAINGRMPLRSTAALVTRLRYMHIHHDLSISIQCGLICTDIRSDILDVFVRSIHSQPCSIRAHGILSTDVIQSLYDVLANIYSYPEGHSRKEYHGTGYCIM